MICLHIMFLAHSALIFNVMHKKLNLLCPVCTVLKTDYFMDGPLKLSDILMKERNSKCSVPIHSHFWQAEILSIRSEVCFNTTQLSTTWIDLEAFIEPENAVYFMLLQWIDKFGIPSIWTTGKEKWKEEKWSLVLPVFLYIITANSK